MKINVQRVAATFIFWVLFLGLGLGVLVLLKQWGVVADSIGFNLLFTVVLVAAPMTALDVARARFWSWNQDARTKA
jgi:hypothetical protein